jgi:hypothetical protein
MVLGSRRLTVYPRCHLMNKHKLQNQAASCLCNLINKAIDSACMHVGRCMCMPFIKSRKREPLHHCSIVTSFVPEIATWIEYTGAEPLLLKHRDSGTRMRAPAQIHMRRGLMIWRWRPPRSTSSISFRSVLFLPISSCLVFLERWSGGLVAIGDKSDPQLFHSRLHSSSIQTSHRKVRRCDHFPTIRWKVRSNGGLTRWFEGFAYVL